ncbi:MAG: hypothetical protein IPJ20_23775 [Flammeovirgaceae bacterium]|nr:hypothetical protein [Flammeovirgaceae bacterium]
MIFELEKNDFSKILPLYFSEEKTFPLILAVIQERQRGRVFVDNPIQPESAMIMNDFGFLQLVGTKKFEYDFIKSWNSQGFHHPICYGTHLTSKFRKYSMTFYMSRSDGESECDLFIKENRRIPCRMPTGFNTRRLDNELIKKPWISNWILVHVLVIY